MASWNIPAILVTPLVSQPLVFGLAAVAEANILMLMTLAVFQLLVSIGISAPAFLNMLFIFETHVVSQPAAIWLDVGSIEEHLIHRGDLRGITAINLSTVIEYSRGMHGQSSSSPPIPNWGLQ